MVSSQCCLPRPISDFCKKYYRNYASAKHCILSKLNLLALSLAIKLFHNLLSIKLAETYCRFKVSPECCRNFDVDLYKRSKFKENLRIPDILRVVQLKLKDEGAFKVLQVYFKECYLRKAYYRKYFRANSSVRLLKVTILHFFLIITKNVFESFQVSKQFLRNF